QFGKVYLIKDNSKIETEPEIPMPDKFDGDRYKFCVDLIISLVTGEALFKEFIQAMAIVFHDLNHPQATKNSLQGCIRENRLVAKFA
uniref:Uncharacterized protein n=1 Tax=Chelonoidis abingdonii TaxID=106734 RepID=A0A8C0GLX9_CHEAB